MKEFTKKKLVSALSMLMTGLVSTGVSNASDISIYRAAEKGSITLMFLLDNSGSMGSGDNTGMSRLERVRSGMMDVLAGGNGAAALSDDKIIGLSTFYNSSSGYVVVPARALNTAISGGGTFTMKKPLYKLLKNGSTSRYTSCTAWSSYNTCSVWSAVTSTKPSGSYDSSDSCAKDDTYGNCTLYSANTTLKVTDQRSLLLKEMSTWTGSFSTPTAPAYAEVGAYMLGTNTGVPNWYSCGSSGTTNANNCTTLLSTAPNVSGYSIATNATSTYYSTGGRYYYRQTPVGSGFPFSADSAKTSDLAKYTSPIGTANTQCSGQGIYVLTDGEPNSSNATTVAKTLMQNALTSTYSSNLSCSGSLFTKSSNSTTTGWDCISDFSQLLLNRKIDGSTSTAQMNPKNLTIKTAVVGFGGDFNGITSYNSALTQDQNLANINAATASDDVKNAAKWGVYGQGGWYSGSSSKDVVDSVNSFISALATDIPSVTTGSAYVPTDQLNPSAVQNYTYSSQFQPTPDATYQLWAGNLKKYQVSTGYVKDVKGNSITDSNGKIIDNYDYWSANVSSSITNSDAMKLIGGVKANLPLGLNVSNKANRKVLINRDTSGTETSTTLNKIDESYVTNTTDSSRGYLLSLLGYKIADPANPPSKITDLAAISELRQLGAVMHSSPLLLTQSGVIGSTNGDVTTSDRDDYILFGTTQGVLSVVDASSGVEKFAFVPNEMVTTQKKAFLDYTTTSGFSTSTYQPFYYGIDAPWTSYSEYVLKTDKTAMTVGTGVGSSSGVQMAYGGLRMGGRSYYALNLQDMSSPRLAFRIDPNSGKVYYNNSSTTYKELPFMGQSWSKPTIGFVKWNGKKTRVMFVGGGYDAGGTNGDGTFDTSTGERTGFSGYESADYNQASQTKKIGAGVYMFDATTGALLWWGGANATSSNTTAGVGYSTASDMQYSVASQIRGVDRNADDLIDHLYFGDLGGQVWRVDLNNNMATFDKNTFAKTPVRILNLNNGIYSPRFYEMPAFSTYSNLGVKFGVVSIGSGNRSLPRFNTSSSSYKNDAVYNVYDKDVARSDLFNMSSTGYTVCGTTGTTCTGTILNTQNKVLADLGQLTTNANKTDAAPFASKAGWYYYFASSLTQDAKVLSTPIVLDSDMYVTTFDGSKAGLSGDCGAGVKGESFVYQFCMPYGKCTDTQVAASTFLSGTSLGAGIVSPAVGSSNSTGSNRAMISGNGVLAGGKSRTYSTPLSLVPVRWYETTK